MHTNTDIGACHEQTKTLNRTDRWTHRQTDKQTETKQKHYLDDVLVPIVLAVLEACELLHSNRAVAGKAALLHGGAGHTIIAGLSMASLVPTAGKSCCGKCGAYTN